MIGGKYDIFSEKENNGGSSYRQPPDFICAMCRTGVGHGTLWR